ncbi:ATP-dependent endonuclease [Exiguobacterium sp. S90]|uniref:ATP-dependent nuclease n=1 Tax=Exiguobacterium sp. S90 TaxID=1221231 RepID=UPI001BEB0D8A|nr:AAA family ATPase [Exiguobacterium sp. S90]
MKLIMFEVENYKIFKNKFSIQISPDSISILTGRNNTGKSTLLESINHFYLVGTKGKMPSQNFSVKNQNIDIVMKATFEDHDGSQYVIHKVYKEDKNPTFYSFDGIEIKSTKTKTHELYPILEKILANKPFYITPSMLPDDINDLIQLMYEGIFKNRLDELELESCSENDKTLAIEYIKLKQSIPKFLSKIKSSTDVLLEDVSSSVSRNIQSLFSNQELSLSIVGGNSDGFTSNDLLKTTRSSVHISKPETSEMPLSNQGTGLQRMSLIFLIQNMIEKKLIGGEDSQLLLIDEPEAFLHPEAVRALSRSLYAIGQKMPLMISTHSPILIDLTENHTAIQVFRIDNVLATQIFKSSTKEFDKDDIKNMKILNYTDSYVNEFFFADNILIVEGDTEYLAFKHFAQDKNINLHIIRARGKSTIKTLMKILNQFNTNYNVLHDVDNDTRYSSSTLKAQLTNCKSIFKEKSKSSKIRIFCSVSNFEQAIGMENVPNKHKTKNIFEILHSSSANKSLTKIEKLFKVVIENSDHASLPESFRLIESDSQYDKLFKIF